MENVLVLLIAQKLKYTEAAKVRKEEMEIWKDKEALKKKAAEHAQKQLNNWVSANKGLSQDDIAKRRAELEKIHLDYFTEQAASQIETAQGFIRTFKEREREFDLAITKLGGKKKSNIVIVKK